MPYRDPTPRDWKLGSLYPESPLELDEEIEPLVLALNRLGYPTSWSCAGHSKKPPFGEKGLLRGFVDFSSELLPEEKVEVMSLARRFGLKGVRWSKTYGLTFNPVGEPEGLGMWDESQR